MPDEREPDGWTDGTRDVDGACAIQDNASGFWVAISPGGVRLLHCPCCNRKLITRRAAQLVADQVFPRYE